MKTLKQAFKELESTLVKNVANDLIQLEFHEVATDEELEAYYGGTVNREAMIEDTLKRLAGSQQQLRFIQGRIKILIEKYGDKKATDDIVRTEGRPAGDGTAEEGVDTGNGEAPVNEGR